MSGSGPLDLRQDRLEDCTHLGSNRLVQSKPPLVSMTTVIFKYRGLLFKVARLRRAHGSQG
eukprot:7025378-Lingulodinium_polyedra.AAC.1